MRFKPQFLGHESIIHRVQINVSQKTVYAVLYCSWSDEVFLNVFGRGARLPATSTKNRNRYHTGVSGFDEGDFRNVDGSWAGWTPR